jgi:hypothetical protein
LGLAGLADVVADFLGGVGGDEELHVLAGDQAVVFEVVADPVEQRRPVGAVDEDRREELDAVGLDQVMLSNSSSIVPKPPGKMTKARA